MAGDLFIGTLELLILGTVQDRPIHGYGIARWIRERTEGVLAVDQGALKGANIEVFENQDRFLQR